MSGGRTSLTDYRFQIILRLTEQGLTVAEFDREVYPEVIEDVVAEALGAK